MTVYLVGAGPGDPGLITVRGAELLQSADIVVYDRLAGTALLDLADDGAELMYVGKESGQPSLSQTEINLFLVRAGLAGKNVVRLKGGDPFVFARGGEEVRALQDAGVPFEIVPGITSAIAAPAYAGIPVTMRYTSTSFTVVTGHEDPEKGFTSVNWEAIVHTGGTIVILMGVRRIVSIVEQLLAAGMPADTPAAAVHWGTRANQRTVRSTVAQLPNEPLAAPSVIVVGGVAAVDLSWFEKRALFGRKIVVTRSRQQTTTMATKLRELGADPIEVPTVKIVDPTDGGKGFRKAIGQVADYHWLVVTSPNGARRVLAELADARALVGVQLAAVGPKTASLLADAHLVADLVPDIYVAESLVAKFPRAPQSGGRVLLAQAEVARKVLLEGLQAKGWSVDVVAAYRTDPVKPHPSAIDELAEADTITFTSGSTVTNFLAAYGGDAMPANIASIGPVTSQVIIDAGFTVNLEATEHTLDGLVAALLAGRFRD
jgi:uroporphyrinogen III methyltransferase / synthase